MLKNEIKINKTITIILLLISILVIGISSSYALFQKTIIKDNFIKLETGTTDITTTIENYSSNLITLASGESKTLNITLSNITEYDILYQMYYTVESGNGTITTTELTDNAKGTMNNTKTLAITIQNNNANEITIKVATKGALINSSITLEENEYEFLTDITPPVISNISDVGEGKITFTVSDTGSGVSKYCVNQSQADTTSCTWLDAVNGEQTTDVVAEENGDYYVHVKDLAGNISHSSKVSLSLNTPAGSLAEEKYGTGGLIAVNTSGTLYDGTGTIREYRYSGASVNNYIKFNNGEIWRIVGVFKNSSGEWNLKIMRNTVLTTKELPSTYTYNGTNHTIEEGNTGKAYWSSTNYNDWTTAGLQYYLNGTNGYFGTLSSKAQSVVDTSYTYYLGNVTAYENSNADTTITSYINERGSTICGSSVVETSQNNNCNVWYGNKAIWSGKVALLYPSDYGYSAISSYWSGTNLYNYDTAATTSWMQTTVDHITGTAEWLLSPSSFYFSSLGTYWIWSGLIGDYRLTGTRISLVRPVLNLLSTAPIDTNHQGTSSDPYIILE